MTVEISAPSTACLPSFTGVLSGAMRTDMQAEDAHALRPASASPLYFGPLRNVTSRAQMLSEAGLRALGPAVAHMAGVEGLDAHARAVTLRLDALGSA